MNIPDLNKDRVTAVLEATIASIEGRSPRLSDWTDRGALAAFVTCILGLAHTAYPDDDTDLSRVIRAACRADEAVSLASFYLPDGWTDPDYEVRWWLYDLAREYGPGVPSMRYLHSRIDELDLLAAVTGATSPNPS